MSELATENRPRAVEQQMSLFGEAEQDATARGSFSMLEKEQAEKKNNGTGRRTREKVLAIQDLLWKEAIWAVHQSESFSDSGAFEQHLREHLPQNSLETRVRYAQNIMRWFFPDGPHGVVGQVWAIYHRQPLVEELLRYRYLVAEPMVGATVAEALHPIAENALVPSSYLDNFLRSRFGDMTPAKSIKRVKANLRKLSFLVRAKGEKDTLRALCPSATGLLLALRVCSARVDQCGVPQDRWRLLLSVS